MSVEAEMKARWGQSLNDLFKTAIEAEHVAEYI